MMTSQQDASNQDGCASSSQICFDPNKQWYFSLHTSSMVCSLHCKLGFAKDPDAAKVAGKGHFGKVISAKAILAK